MRMPALFTLLIALLSVAAAAQEDRPLSEILSAAERARAHHWQQGDYEGAVAALEATRERYLAADSNEQRINVPAFEALLCEMARAYARLNQPAPAVDRLQEYFDLAYATYSTRYREVGYYHLSHSSDFDAIRTHPGFQALLTRFKAVGWQTILEQHASYHAIASTLLPFVYVDATWEGLAELRTKYGLDSIAGTGGDVSQIVNLMSWVHRTIRHDGNSGEPEDRHADALIELARKENRGLNCWMLSTVLNEISLAMGFRSRIVSCYPKGDPSITHEWHVVVEVYSPSLGKWLFMDPSTETYVRDDANNMLSIREIRQRLIDKLPVHVSPGINTNGVPFEDRGESYLHDYLAKNLFRISIPLFSVPAYEMIPRKTRIYVELLPAGYNPRNVKFHEIVGRSASVIYTTDARQFWAAPGGE